MSFIVEGSSKKSLQTYENETVWLSIDQMAELFQRDKSTISRHIKNVYDEGELIRQGTVAKFATVQKEGMRDVERNIEYCKSNQLANVIANGLLFFYYLYAFSCIFS